jgi:peptidoglycan-N-acetylglucosamine deacetylase
MKNRDFFFQLPENAVFWLLLLFLAAGSASSLYGKATGRIETAASGRVLSPISVISPQAASSALAPITQVSGCGPLCALTFDMTSSRDDPGPVLAALESAGVNATFFLSEDWVLSHPEETKALSESGHEIGLTSAASENHRGLSKSELRARLVSLADTVRTLTGQTPSLFRPPYGDPENPITDAASDLGYAVIGASCDSLDWKDYGSEAIAAQILNECEPESGSIIQFRGGAKYTAVALEPILSGLQGLGLSATTVSGLFPDS